MEASLVNQEGLANKLDIAELTAGGGVTIEFAPADIANITEPPVGIGINELPSALPVLTARVEVTPVGSDSCYSEPALTSFVLKGDGQREFLPSSKQEDVFLKFSIGIDDPVIKDPIIKGPVIVIP